MSDIRWGAVLIGVLAGLGITIVAAIGLFAVGVRPEISEGGAAFVFVQFLGQVAAGYVAGRFTPSAAAFHGSQGGLFLYGVTAALTLAVGGQPGVGAIVFSAVVAMILGSAGGVLADHQQGR